MFDLRNLEHSTIVYEDPLKTPLMRLAWNKQNTQYLATFAQDSSEVIKFFASNVPYLIPLQVIIIDMRIPCSPMARLKNHQAAVNGVAWAPHSGQHICTAG